MLDELDRRHRRSFQMQKLHDLKQVFAGIAARIGGPVETAAGRLAQLERQPQADGGAERLSAARLALLELRDFARKLGGLAGRRTGVPLRVSVEALCRAAAAELRRRVPRPRSRLEILTAEGIRCHPDELAQVLRHLLDNAVEAGPPQAVRLRTESAGTARSASAWRTAALASRPARCAGRFARFTAPSPATTASGCTCARPLVERNGGSIRIHVPARRGGPRAGELPERDAMSDICIYTDGGCSGNPGPGAWAYILLAGGERLSASAAHPATTNNRMELEAVIAALREVHRRPEWAGASLEVFTDSEYVQKGITSWIRAWEANGWRTSGKQPVKNQDLWKELLRLSSGHCSPVALAGRARRAPAERGVRPDGPAGDRPPEVLKGGRRLAPV